MKIVTLLTLMAAALAACESSTGTLSPATLADSDQTVGDSTLGDTAGDTATDTTGTDTTVETDATNPGTDATIETDTSDTTQEPVCGSCHTIPPSNGHHPTVFKKHKYLKCTACHFGLVDANGTKNLAPDKHQNGTKDVSLEKGGTWNSAAKSCDPACHGKEYW